MLQKPPCCSQCVQCYYKAYADVFDFPSFENHSSLLSSAIACKNPTTQTTTHRFNGHFSGSAKCFLLGHHFLSKIALIQTFS